MYVNKKLGLIMENEKMFNFFRNFIEIEVSNVMPPGDNPKPEERLLVELCLNYLCRFLYFCTLRFLSHFQEIASLIGASFKTFLSMKISEYNGRCNEYHVSWELSFMNIFLSLS